MTGSTTSGFVCPAYRFAHAGYSLLHRVRDTNASPQATGRNGRALAPARAHTSDARHQTLIVHFRSAVIAVGIRLDGRRRHHLRMGSVEHAQRFAVRASRRRRPRVRFGGPANACPDIVTSAIIDAASTRFLVMTLFLAVSRPCGGNAHGGIGLRARFGHPFVSAI